MAAIREAVGGWPPSTRLRASLGLLLGTLVASATGFARESALAAALGLGVGFDQLATGVAITLMISSSLVSASNGVLTPLFVQHRPACSLDSRRVVGAALLMCATAGLFLAGLLVAVSSGSSSVLDGGLYELPIEAMLATAAVVGMLRGMAASLLNASSIFGIPALCPAIGSTIVTAAAVVASNPSSSDLAYWFVVGLALETMFLVVFAVVRVRPSWPTAPAIRRVAGLTAAWLASLGGTLVFALNPVVDLIVAGTLSEGAASQLALAARIPLALAALGAVVIATPAFTAMSEAFVRDGHHGVSRIAFAEARSVFVRGTGAAVVLSGAGYLVAVLAYSQGEMSAADAAAVGTTQLVYSLSILPYVAGVVLNRGLLAENRQHYVLITGVVGAAINVGLDIILGSWWGVNGIAGATAAVYAATMAIALYALRRGSDQGSVTLAP